MKRVLIIAAIVAIAGYGLFEARRILAGPEIIIDAPLGGSATSTTLVTVLGHVSNISFLTINDKPASADEEGRFVYRYSPPPGYTALVVKASDRFGRKAQKSVAFNVITYCPVTL